MIINIIKRICLILLINERKKMRKIILLITMFLLTLWGSSLANEVNIFSARHYDSDVQLYEKFTAKTGIKVNVVSGKSKALEKPKRNNQALWPEEEEEHGR